MNKITPELLQTYNTLLNQGWSQRSACAWLEIPRSSMQDYLKTLNETPTKEPVIKLVDIETSPSVNCTFGRWKQNIGQDAVISEGGRILTAVVKTLGQDTTRKYWIKNPKERWNGDDFDVVLSLWEEWETADVIVGQNIKRFDQAVLKARIAYHQLPALHPVKLVDTLQIAKQMRFNANSLDSLGSYLGVGRKVKHTGIDLWVRVMKGEKKALEEMLEYNEQDVLLLEQVYLRLRAYDTSSPNLGLFFDDEISRCGSCGSTNIEKTGNTVKTAVSSFETYSCLDCGHVQRSRKNTLSKIKRSNLHTNAK